MVFLKTSEEAKCADNICKNYTYTSALPKVTNMTTAFDATSGTWDLSLTGTGFTGTPEFVVGGVKQTIKSGSTSTSMVV